MILQALSDALNKNDRFFQVNVPISSSQDLFQIMGNEKSTEFIRKEIEADPSRIFEARVCEISNSIIAFGYGTREDGSPNAIGTGFKVANLVQRKEGLFATCLHVMEEIVRIKDLSSTQLVDEGLIDRKRCIAFLKNGKFEWNDVGRIRFSDMINTGNGNFVKTHDVCICNIPENTLPPLSLSPNMYFMGSELGIVGFPNFEHLQKLSVQPYVIKTILSSHMRYPFEIENVLSLDKIPGEDDKRLLDFLASKFGVDWRKNAKIEKIDDGRTIKISTGKNSISLRLNDENTKISLEIDNVKTDKFNAVMEKGKLTIYEGIESERIALDCIAGEGFSGSPVFSVRDGKIVGMVDYMPTKWYIEDLKRTRPILTEENIRVNYAAGISFAVPSKLIQKCLEYALMADWDDPGVQTHTIPRT